MSHIKMAHCKRRVSELNVGDVVKGHGKVTNIHTEGSGATEKRVIGFTRSGDGRVEETKIWSPTRVVDRVEASWVEVLAQSA